MAERSGFFSAKQNEDGSYDREYLADEFAEYFANFISNGVYVTPANQLKVTYSGAPDKLFTVIVKKGKAYIDGFWYELTEDMEVTLPANTSAYAIKDVIRCTLDRQERKVSITVETNVTSELPRNNSAVHDLVLSTIIVQANATKINAEDITDKRADKTYCGFVSGVVEQIDTTELFQQYDDAFQEWFNEIKGQLSTDAAGNLQKQIGRLADLATQNKDNLVAAINELMLAMHPIGSVYLSYEPTDPSELFGGTWVGITGVSSADSDPRFLYVVNPNNPSDWISGKQGGSATKTLTISELPKHNHYVLDSAGRQLALYKTNAGAGTDWDLASYNTVYAPTNIHTHYAGEGKEFDITPPYEVVYGWKRIA